MGVIITIMPHQEAAQDDKLSCCEKEEIKDILSRRHKHISREDWIASYDSFMQEFDKMDTNNDGEVDRAEWIALHGNDDGFDCYDMDDSNTMDMLDYRVGHLIEGDLARIDSNNDGKITKEEWIARYGNEDGFDRFDLNGDGIVDADEFRVSELACMQLQQGDTNRDGKFDRAEWIKKFGNDDDFDDYDLNGDGSVDAYEFVKMKYAKVSFNHLDTDRDGKVTKEEWIARHGSLDGFDTYDLNGDGVLTQDEFNHVITENIDAVHGEEIFFAHCELATTWEVEPED